MITFQLRNRNPENISNKDLAKLYFDMIMATKLEIEDINPQFAITRISQEDDHVKVTAGITYKVSHYGNKEKQQEIIQWIKSLRFSTSSGDIISITESDVTPGIWWLNNLQEVDTVALTPYPTALLGYIPNEISQIINWRKADILEISYEPGYSSIGLFMTISLIGPQAKDPNKMKDELAELIYSK